MKKIVYLLSLSFFFLSNEIKASESKHPIEASSTIESDESADTFEFDTDDFDNDYDSFNNSESHHRHFQTIRHSSLLNIILAFFGFKDRVVNFIYQKGNQIYAFISSFMNTKKNEN